MKHNRISNKFEQIRNHCAVSCVCVSELNYSLHLISLQLKRKKMFKVTQICLHFFTYGETLHHKMCI